MGSDLIGRTSRVLHVGTSVSFQSHTGLSLVPANKVPLSKLRAADVIMIAPSSRSEPGVGRILALRRLGLLKPTLVLFVSYKGVHFHPNSPKPHPLASQVDGWVVHSESESNRLGGDRTFFVALSSRVSSKTRQSSLPPRWDVFFGGRQNRDFDLAYAVARQVNLRAVFISDLLPAHIRPTDRITVVKRKLPKRAYARFMARSKVVGLPLQDVQRAHGQSDASLALALGKPIICTRNQSCDDYVPGQNGLLVEQNPNAWVTGLTQLFDHLERFNAGAKALSSLVSPDLYYEKVSAGALRLLEADIGADGNDP